MKYLISISLVIIVTLLIFLRRGNKTQTEVIKTGSPVLIQLFTSQGCSSCPSADALLQKLNREEKLNIVSLAYHVDYWNTEEWKDPFSSPNYTQLQYNYERHFGHGSVYTPQVVVNGSLQFIGSDEDKMRNAIKFFNTKSYGNTIEIQKVKIEEGKIDLNYNVQGNLDGKHLLIALVLANRKTEIKKGENGGITLNNTDIVVQQKTLNLNSENGNSVLSIPKLVKNDEQLSLVAFVQDKNLMITGVTKIKLDK